jgi:Glycine cleavage system protein P (pyridoxal-binding), C-terminal domain
MKMSKILLLCYLFTNSVTKILEFFEKNNINLGKVDNKTVRISLDESTTLDDVKELVLLFSKYQGKTIDESKIFENVDKIVKNYEDTLARKTDLLNQDIFNKIHSEHQMLRYIHYLAAKDITLTKSMISLGSCTMKLNATTEMVTIQNLLND